MTTKRTQVLSYHAELEKLGSENAALKAENVKLKALVRALRKGHSSRSAEKIPVDERAKKVLQFIARREYATTSHVAQGLSIDASAAGRRLKRLLRAKYIRISEAMGQDPEFHLEPRGAKFLRAEGQRLKARSDDRPE